MRALFALALVLSLPHIASAADWRYCLAPSHAEHKIYISLAFPASVPMESAESQFGRKLRHSGLRYDDVQCPRSGDEPSLTNMERHAVSFNRELGNQVITMRWQPAR
jgi:hypothetical protein